MTIPNVSMCAPWATAADVCAPCDAYDFDAVLLDDCLQAASEVLFELSGRRFSGECEATVRPCGSFSSLLPPVTWSPSSWVLISGREWNGFCSCNRESRCGCSRLSDVSLGASPVTDITEVKVDGAVLDPARYRVDDWRWLVRLADADGTNPGWPCCQRMDLASSEEDTFEVSFKYGVAPPQVGVRAAAVLACELAQGCSGEDCRLPERVTSYTRQGVSAVILDPFQFLDNGKTGIYEIDLFLTAYPRRRPMAIMSPDIGQKVRRVDT